MAHYFGRSSPYLYRQTTKYYVIAIGLFVLYCMLLWFAMRYTSRYPYLYIALMLGFVLPVFKIVRRKSFFFKKRSRNYESGILGEDVMRNELLKLDNSYAVFQNLHTPGRNANIDFVVAGPTGIFVIEVKNVHGGNETTRRYYIHEVNEEYWGLFNYFKETFQHGIFVTPILAFNTNQGMHNLYMTSSDGHIHILPIDDVNQFITSQPMQNRPITNQQLHQALRNLTE